MKVYRVFVWAMVLALAAPVAAEKLEMDHRLYPPLHAAMDSTAEETIYFDARTPGRVFDRVLINGRSAERDWTEALEITVLRRDKRLKDPAEWYRSFRAGDESTCPAEARELGRDRVSVTFAVEAPACATGPGLTGLYRVVLGAKSVYLVSAKVKGPMAAEPRAQWLAVLASAHLSN